jgi:hypothetical protein
MIFRMQLLAVEFVQEMHLLFVSFLQAFAFVFGVDMAFDCLCEAEG